MIVRLTCIGVLALSLAFMATLAAPNTAHAASADYGPFQNASQLCTAFDDFGFPSHGDCVSAFRSSAGISDFCQTYLVPEGYFPNQGQCVSTLNQLYKGTGA